MPDSWPEKELVPTPKLQSVWEPTLFDDDSVREKLSVLTKWEAMLDDARNPDCNLEEF